tara:strand:- start:13488 stop:14087 length:600 start_codon:yes stop_codon:yes gene_type:complete
MDINFKKSKYKIILGSGSPRRKMYFDLLKIPYKVMISNIDEIYPTELKESEISDYLAKLKSKNLKSKLKKNEILVTADTIVWCDGKHIGKPRNNNEAFKTLTELSGKFHSVVTSVSICDIKNEMIFNEKSYVKFKKLSENEINYYVKNFKVMDKAGAYGIQDWIGIIATEKIKGSYTNIVGFPVSKFLINYNKFKNKLD